MEITSVDQHHLVYDLDGAWEPTWVPGVASDTHEVDLFEVHTDAGVTGVTALPSFPGGGLDLASGYEAALVGTDPRDVGGVLRKLDTVEFLGADAWHLELACWDVLGKHLDAPVWRLLGGSPEPVPAYASTGERQSAAERASYVEDRVGEGFEAVKLRFHAEDPEADLEVARYVREEHPGLTLMVDANMGWEMRLAGESERYGPKQALRVARALEDVGVAWFEEPLPMHHYERLADLRAATSVPIAGGESVAGPHVLRQYLAHGSLDVYQPDAVFATGIRQGKAIADEARGRGFAFDPHTWSNGLGLAANLHLIAVTDADYCEYPHEPPFDPGARDFFLESTVEHEDGMIRPPEDPGLGVEIDWDAVAAAEEPL